MKDPLEYLLSLPRFADAGAEAYRPGLERIEALLGGMGRPDEVSPIVHVGGTNGKGTTASLIAAIGTASGLQMGLHTSPHLLHVGERMRIDGAAAPEAWLERAVEEHYPLFERVGPSFFEATLALSLLYFAEEEVDHAVVEVGLGGRLDATNVVQPEAVVITHVALEHTDLLGSTLAAIAREKAGILKRGVPAFTAVRKAEALDVLREEAKRRDAPLESVWETVRLVTRSDQNEGVRFDAETPLRSYDGLEVELLGEHHRGNVALALRVAEQVLHAPEASIRGGMQQVKALSGLRGRYDVVAERPAVIADVAHNADALRPTLAAAASRARQQGGRLFVLLGMLKDKNVQAVARACRRHEAQVFATALPTERALGAEKLLEILKSESVPVVGSGSLSEGLGLFEAHSSEVDVLLVTGSHWMVAELFAEGDAPFLERTLG